MNKLVQEILDNNILLEVENGELKVFAGDNFENPALISEIRAHKTELVRFLLANKQNDTGEHGGYKIALCPPQESYVLSSAQRRLWMLSEIGGGSMAYHMCGLYEFEGDIDHSILEASFRVLIDRHEILRTVFRENKDGEVRQIIQRSEDSGFGFEYTDISSSAEQGEVLGRLIRPVANTPFDLEKGPLIRAGLIRLADKKWVFFHVMHHIIGDGWSMGVLFRELNSCYEAGVQGHRPDLAPLPFQYKDFAAWQQGGIREEALSGHREYWLRKLEGELPVLRLPEDFLRPPVKTYAGGIIHGDFNANVSRRFKTINQREDATLFMGLLAIVNILLYRYTGQRDIILGTPVAGRNQKDLEGQIGVYINMVTLRTSILKEDTYTSLLKRIRQDAVDAYGHMYYPFDELVNDMNVQWDPARSPLFDVMVVLHSADQDYGGTNGRFDTVKVRSFEGVDVSIQSKYDLTLNFIEDTETLKIKIEYNSDIFSGDTVQRLFCHLEQLMTVVIDDPSMSISHADYLSEKEKYKILVDFNDTMDERVAGNSIVELFKAQAKRSPAKVALVFGGIAYTYKELDELTNQLGKYLYEHHGVKKNDLVGIKLDRSEWLLIAILGVMKSGGAYVPMDPAYPSERLEYVINDSGCVAVIDDGLIHAIRGELATYDKSELDLPYDPGDRAYVIYTSGSTGRPKGVMVTHGNVINFFAGMDKGIGVHEDDRLLAITSSSFDISVLELLWTICSGIEVVIHPSDGYPGALDRYVLKEDLALSAGVNRPITLLQSTPSYIKMLDEDAGSKNFLRSLKKLLIGGEAFPANLARKLKSEYPAEVFNMYGPTETTIWSCMDRVEDGFSKVVIGKPISNTQVYILDADLQLLPIGVTGDLYIGGKGVAKGYLNKRELTVERFIQNPFKNDDIIYFTGDKARWLEDGRIEFVGRKDDQLKVRGYRVEPGEVENALLNHPDITSAVVVGRWSGSSGAGEMSLVAYVVGGNTVDRAGLRMHLGKTLPAYMIPDHFIQLEEFPLTPNGKIDKARLPGPMDMAIDPEVTFVAPRDAREMKLAKVWEEVLGKEKIGIKDSFFDNGGNSLKLARLASQIYKIFEVKVGLKDLFVNTVLEDQAELIRQAQRTAFVPIPPAPLQEGYLLTSVQRRMWVLSQFEEANVAYNIVGAFIFEGKLEPQGLSLALKALIGRHEILRTIFRQEGSGQVVQVVRRMEEFPSVMTCHDLREDDCKESDIARIVRECFDMPFDLSAGPLIRANLIRESDTKWVFAWVMHHIISDGISKSILMNELLQLYNYYALGIPSKLPSLRIQYKDYAVWQKEQFSSAYIKELQDFWTGQFEGELPQINLSVAKARPALKTYNGASVYTFLRPEVVDGLKNLAHEQDATLFMVILTVVNILLYKYSGQSDIIIGTPIAGRDHPDLDGQLGFFANTLAFRTKFDARESFTAVLKNVRLTALNAYEHQLYPLDELVDLLEVQRDMSRNPLFEIEVILQEMEIDITRAEIPGLAITEYKDVENLTSKFDLVFDFADTGSDFKAGIVYNTDLFDRNTSMKLLGHLQQLLLSVLEGPGKPIDQLNYLGAEERARLLEEYNDTEVSYAEGLTLVSLFKEQVDRTPGSVAVVSGGGGLSYAELDRRSGELANYLREQYGLVSGELVGLMMGRSERVIIGILGILKAGGAYVPVDPGLPKPRKEFIVKDTGMKVLLTEAEYLFDLDYYGGDVFAMDVQLEELEGSGSDGAVEVGPGSLAYIIYTSGSTGEPKGVMVEHRGIVNTILSQRRIFEAREGEGHLQFSSLGFDASVSEIFVALLSGGVLYVVEEEVRKDPVLLGRYLAEKGIAMATLPPVYLRQLERSSLAPLKRLITAGEAARRGDALRYLGYGKYMNAYGPTETSICATVYKVEVEEELRGENVPIGRPIDNTRIYIVDGELNVVAEGVVGEICISGAGLARGYWKRPGLTEEKFVADPFRSGGRMYRTGDLGRWLEGGNIEFVGRRDEQVKIRGYRVELGEIEQVLGRYAGIGTVVVMARQDKGEDKYLVAYLTAGQEVDEGGLKGYAGRMLPEYMLPRYYVRLESLPLTSNGKVDRRRLPLPEEAGLPGGVAYVAARNETEAKLVGIWEEVLDRAGVGVKDNFFELGGHSLKVTRLASRLHKEFQVRVELKELFTTAVLEEQAMLLAGRVRTQYAPIGLVEESAGGYALSSSQRRLWVLSQLEEGNVAYNMTGVYEWEGRLEEGALEYSLGMLLGRHEILRTVFRRDEQGEVRQYVRREEETGFRMEYWDMRGREDREERIKELVESSMLRAFDLSAGPLLRVGLWRVSEERWVFMHVMHHIISDGLSMNILIRELMQLYNARVRGAADPLPGLRIQYKDYASWQQGQLNAEALQEHKAYWLGQLGGELPVLELPGDRVRPAVKTYRGGTVTCGMGRAMVEGLGGLSREMGGTLFMGLLASVKVLLYKYTGQGDMIIGSPIAGREHGDLEGQIGFYINTLALRTRFVGTESYREILSKIKEVTLSAYAHQSYPFDELVEALGLQRDISRNPLFDVWVVLQDKETGGKGAAEWAGDMRVKGYGELEHVPCRFDWLFNFSGWGEELQVSISYNADIYDRERMLRVGDHLVRLMEEVVGRPDEAIDGLEMLGEEEKAALLEKGESRSGHESRYRTVIEMFREQVSRHPAALSVVYGDREVSYGELDRLSTALSKYLRREYGVGVRDLVGLRLERSEWLVIGILGVLKSGGAYVPMDPEYPAERLLWMEEDSGCKVVLDKGEVGRFRDWLEGGEVEEEEWHWEELKGEELAYVIYTSGSTGRPKGVMISHGSLVDYVEGLLSVTNVGECGSFGLVSTIGADLGNTVLYGSLATGGVLHIYSGEEVMSGARMGKVEVDCVKIVPSHWKALQSAGKVWLPGKSIIFGGEPLTGDVVELIRGAGRGCRVYNHYGPTETTVGKLLKEVELEEGGGGKVALGRPFGNNRVYVLDRARRLVPVGVVGEIGIGGAGVGQGYWKREAETGKKFVSDPNRAGGRMYLTGDMGRMLETGEIEFMGRGDDQVKIRGYRVELGEIEEALRSHAGIGGAVVLSGAGAGGEQRLVGYVVSGEGLDVTELRSYLGRKLPSHMIPAVFISLERIPLTGNGKVDRQLLLGMVDWGAGGDREQEGPRNETERRLVKIWSEVLGAEEERIGIRSNFFEIGGHSLTAIRIVLRIHEQFNVEIELSNFFNSPDIESLAVEIENISWLREASAEV